MTVEHQMENLRYNIWALRTNLQLTQDKLAELSGLSHVTISRFETGNGTDGQIRTILAIANALGTDLETLFNRKVKVIEPIKPYMKNRR